MGGTVAKTFDAAVTLACGVWLTYLGATLRVGEDFVGSLLVGTVVMFLGIFVASVGLGRVIRTNIEAARG